MAEGQLLKFAGFDKRKDAPVAITRGSAAAGDGKCYFVSERDNTLRMYDVEKDDWFLLRNTPFTNSSLAVIDGLLTAIGGKRGIRHSADYEFTNKLYSLSNRRGWIEKFPPMKMDPAQGVNSKKESPAIVQSGNSLIVIGGRTESMPQSRIDVLNTRTLEWSDAPELPRASSAPSATICGDRLYVMNSDGWVVQCFLDELLGQSEPAGSVWSTIANAPQEYATCGSLSGHLVAIGGKGYSSTINAYVPTKNSWYNIDRLDFGRSKPLVAQLSEDKLILVGGERHDHKPVVQTGIVVGGW